MPSAAGHQQSAWQGRGCLGRVSEGRTCIGTSPCHVNSLAKHEPVTQSRFSMFVPVGPLADVTYCALFMVEAAANLCRPDQQCHQFWFITCHSPGSLVDAGLPWSTNHRRQTLMKITCSSQSQVPQLPHGGRASTTNLMQLLVVVHTKSITSAFIMHQQMLPS